jgi:hypothetical protein
LRRPPFRGRQDAAEVLQRIATFNPLPTRCAARRRGRIAGTSAERARTRRLAPGEPQEPAAILPLRTAERNVETIQKRSTPVSSNADLGVSADEAHLVYEVLKAMSEADRARFCRRPRANRLSKDGRTG